MRELLINGETMTSKVAMYAQFERLFNLPPHFGNNLDALWDVLLEETEPTTIHFKNVQFLFDEMGEYGEKVLYIFQRLHDQTDQYTVYFYEGEIDE